MIKINNNTPTDITWTQNNQVYVVAAMQKDGTYVYGRAGIYKTGTLPTGVASLTCTKTSATCEPTSQTGTVANNAAIYHGDRLYWTATASPYYTVSVPYYNSSSSTYFTDFKSTRTATGVSLCGVTAERATRSVTATINDHISSIAVSFTKKSDGGSGSTIVTSSGSIADVWQGGAITYTPSASLYWTASAGTIAAGAGAASIAPTASRAPRTVNVNVNENISSVKVTYTETGTGQSISVTKTSSGSVANVWQGDTVTYTVTPATYWTSSGGSYNAGTSAITISPTASRAARATNVTINAQVSSVSVSYTNISGSSASITKTTSGSIASVWQGADITYTVATDTYWTASGGTISAGTGTATIAPVASRAPRSVTTIVDGHVTGITVTYTNTETGSSASTTRTSTGSVSNVWQGAGISYSVTTEDYWSSAPGTYEAGTSAVNIYPTTTRTARSVNVVINNYINAVTVNYTNTSGESKSATIASNQPISGVWQGAQINYTPSCATYWSAPGGGFQPGTSSVSIAPTASRSPRAVSVTKPAGAAMTATGIAPSTGSSQTVTVSTATRYTNNTTVLANKFWQGNQITWSATAPSWGAITPTSGTIDAGTGTATISTELTTQLVTVDSTSAYVTWTAAAATATRTMAVKKVAANTSDTIDDKTTIFFNGNWYYNSSSTAGVHVPLLLAEIPFTANSKANAVALMSVSGKTLYAYRTSGYLNFYVTGSSSSMRLTKTSLAISVWTTGVPDDPDVESDDEYGAYITNLNPYPVTIYINGSYVDSDRSTVTYSNYRWKTLDAFETDSWCPSGQYLNEANLDFYCAGDVKTTSDVSNYSY